MIVMYAPYGVQTTIVFPMVKRAVVDLAQTADWTPAATDAAITKDAGSAVDCTNTVAIVGGTPTRGTSLWKLTLTATELQCASAVIQIVDATTKAVEDQVIQVITYGHASAMLPMLPTAAPGAAGGLFIAGTNAATSVTTALTANITGNITGNLSGSVGSLTTNNDKTGYGLSAAAVQAIWDALTSALTTVGSIGKKLADWVLGSDSKVILSNNAHTGAVVPTVTTLTGHTPQTGDTYALANGANGFAAIKAQTAAIETDTAEIGAAGAGLTALASAAALATVQADTDDIQTRIPAALVGGRMDASVGAMAANVVTAAAVADGAIDRATFAADTGLQPARSNTAQAGAAGSITLDASASATTDFYVGMWIYLPGGTGAGQARVCTAYNGTSKVATIAPNWAINPDATSTFAVLTAAQITGVQGAVTGSVGSVTGAVGSVTGNVGGNVTGDVAGKVIGGGGSTITGTGARVVDSAGNDVAPASATTSIQADTNDIQGRLPAALDTGRMVCKAEVVSDKTGYSLTQSFPANFADLAITAATGRVTVGTNADKTGYSISGTKTTLDALNDLSAAAVNAEVDTALADVNLDHLVGSATGIPAVPAGTYLDQIMDDGTAVYDRTTDSLQAIRDRGDSAWGGAGSADWTTDERNQIRKALGVTGTTAATEATGELQIVKSKTDNLPADPASVTNQTTILNRLGAFTGSGLNTVLGFFRALLRKDAALTPTDVGGTFDNQTDALEALKDNQLDAAVSSRAAAATALTNATWTDAKAAFLDAAVTSRAAAATALTNATWTDAKAGFIDVAVSSRLATAGYTAPPSAASIATAAWDELTATARAPGSYGQLLKDDINATIGSRAPEAGGNLAAVKTKTDQLAFTGGNVHANVQVNSDKTGYTASVAAGGITAASFAAGAIDAASLSADAGTELAAAIWANGTRTLTDMSGVSLSTAGIDAILDRSLGDLAVGAPPAAFSLRTGLQWLGNERVHRKRGLQNQLEIYNGAGTLVATATHTYDNGTQIYDRSAYVSA